MKNCLFLITVLFSISLFGQQSYTGIINDNYVASYLSVINPSSIVDSKTKFSVSTGLNNSLISNFSAKSSFIYGNETKFVSPKKSGYKNIYTEFNVLNLKYELNHKNAIGYSLKAKDFSCKMGIPLVWSENSIQNYNVNNIVDVNEDISNLSLNKVNYTEHAFTYAKTIFENEKKFLKGGISIKLLNGLGAQYFYVNNGSSFFIDTNGYNVNIKNLDANFGKGAMYGQSFFKNRGLGFDLGFTYEYRPSFDEQYFDMDGEKKLVRYDINKYKWKISGSITDIGWIRFINDPKYYNFSNTIDTIQSNFVYNDDLPNESFDTYILNNVQKAGLKSIDQIESFRMNLPTSIHFNFDYHLKRKFYVSYQISIPISLKNDITKIRNYFIQTITPRVEKEKWALMFPISHMGNGKFYIGCAGRFKIDRFNLFVGSNNISLLYGQKASFSRNIYYGLSYNIFYKVPNDRDLDKVSDEKDICPIDPGLFINNGCPDTDEDGILDKEDQCIYDKGPKSLHGCPDRDEDGIIDMNDMCPDDKGLAIHYGCPDKDKDGVIDVADRCPEVSGIELNNGCPYENHGCCMDDDGDGIPDNMDKCPTISGSVYNNGCPLDSTNLMKVKLHLEKEKIDANNTREQVKQNPTIETRHELISTKEQLKALLEEKDIIADLTLYFDVDHADLNQKEHEKIEKFMKGVPQNEKVGVMIIGYTDNDGSIDYNMILSKKRAETVKRKLIDFFKLNPDYIKVYYYGETRAIHKGHHTSELKQEDRRVEVKVFNIN